MFNRVGNMTILSLARKRNALIENLHAYTRQSNTIHEKLNRKHTGNIESFNDYSSIRIYWKYDKHVTPSTV